jgi:hypothetical protein
MSEEKRLDAAIWAAQKSGLPLDFLWPLSDGLDESSFLKLYGNVVSLPKYIKSMVTPNLSTSTAAFSGKGRR